MPRGVQFRYVQDIFTFWVEIQLSVRARSVQLLMYFGVLTIRFLSLNIWSLLQSTERCDMFQDTGIWSHLWWNFENLLSRVLATHVLVKLYIENCHFSLKETNPWLISIFCRGWSGSRLVIWNYCLNVETNCDVIWSLLMCMLKSFPKYVKLLFILIHCIGSFASFK